MNKALSLYIKYDFGKWLNSRVNKYYYLLLLLLMLLDTVYTYWSQTAFFDVNAEMSAYWYLFLENSHSAVRGVYFLFFPFLAILPFGLQYYFEKKSKYREYLISRGNRISYYLSKLIISFVAGFTTILVFLTINYFLVMFIYPNNFIIGGTFIQPDHGAFLEGIFHNNIYLYEFLYILLNSIIGGILSVLALSLSMIVNYQNNFLVIAVPFIIVTVQGVALYFIKPHFDITTIIQPFSRYAMVDPINVNHVLMSLSAWLLGSSVLFLIGYYKERDLI